MSESVSDALTIDIRRENDIVHYGLPDIESDHIIDYLSPRRRTERQDYDVSSVVM
jgi:hypothetical protein